MTGGCAYSPWTCPCVAPGRCVLTGSGPRWTWLCSQSSWPRGKSGRCEGPCPVRWKERWDWILTEAKKGLSLSFTGKVTKGDNLHHIQQWEVPHHMASSHTFVWGFEFLRCLVKVLPLLKPLTRRLAMHKYLSHVLVILCYIWTSGSLAGISIGCYGREPQGRDSVHLPIERVEEAAAHQLYPASIPSLEWGCQQYPFHPCSLELHHSLNKDLLYFTFNLTDSRSSESTSLGLGRINNFKLRICVRFSERIFKEINKN